MTRHYLRRAAAVALTSLALGAAVVTPRVHAAQQVQFTVTGSTQMYTLGALLANRYTSMHPDLRIDVEPSSSQSGFDTSCTNGAVVGMSDVYIQDSQLTEPGCNDMKGVPVAVSTTTVVYNLPGKYFTARAADGFTLLHPVKLNAQVLADIYMGKVSRWNDREITSLNPGVKLPSKDIQAFNSSEPGGAGFIFNQWLALSVPAWNKSVGVALQPQWPATYSTGESSTGAMVQAIQGAPYSIGFAGFDYAISYKLQAASLKNASGTYLTPSLNGVSLAINKALQLGFPSDFRKPFVTVPDLNRNQHAFNPACFEFLVVHQDLTKHLPDAATRQAIKAFLEWTISSAGGQAFIEQIEFRKVGSAGKTELAHGFVPVPEALRGAIKANVDSIKQ